MSDHCPSCPHLESEISRLRAKLAYIHATAFAAEASPNAKDLRRIMVAADVPPRITGADER